MKYQPGGSVSGVGREHLSKVRIWVAGQKWPIDINFPKKKNITWGHWSSTSCTVHGVRETTSLPHLPLTSRGRISGKCGRGWLLGGVGGFSISTRGVRPKYSATTRTVSWVMLMGRRTWKLNDKASNSISGNHWQPGLSWHLAISKPIQNYGKDVGITVNSVIIS